MPGIEWINNHVVGDGVTATLDNRGVLIIDSDGGTLWPDWSDRANLKTGVKTIETRGTTYLPEDSSRLFSGLTSLNKIDLSGLNTSNVTSMREMFYNCPALWSIDLSPMDTSHVQDMSGMFRKCKGLIDVYCSKIDTSNVKDMSYMFCECALPDGIDTMTFDTSNVTSMKGMFQGCENLEEGVVVFDTSRVEDVSYMFCGCSAMRTVEVYGADAPNLKNMERMLTGCVSLEQVDFKELKASGVTNMSDMLSECYNLQSVDLSGLDTSSVTDMSYMFSLSDIKNVDLSALNTSSVRNMEGMFLGSMSAERLNLSAFDTSNVTNMDRMFAECHDMQSVNLSSFRTPNVTSMEGTFDGCRNLRSLDISNFDTSHVTNMNRLFRDCEELRRLKLDGLDLSSIGHTVNGQSQRENTIAMFEGCKKAALSPGTPVKLQEIMERSTGRLNIQEYIADTTKAAIEQTKTYLSTMLDTIDSEIGGNTANLDAILNHIRGDIMQVMDYIKEKADPVIAAMDDVGTTDAPTAPAEHIAVPSEISTNAKAEADLLCDKMGAQHITTEPARHTDNPLDSVLNEARAQTSVAARSAGETITKTEAR